MIRLAVLFCLITSPAYAMPCWAIRKAVATYGIDAVEAWAKSQGYSDADIAKAKRCLK